MHIGCLFWLSTYAKYVPTNNAYSILCCERADLPNTCNCARSFNLFNLREGLVIMQEIQMSGKVLIHPNGYIGSDDLRVLALNVLDHSASLTNPSFPPIVHTNLGRDKSPMDKEGLEFVDHRPAHPNSFPRQPPLWMGSLKEPNGLPIVREALCAYGATTSSDTRITLASVLPYVPRSADPHKQFFKYADLLPLATAKDRLENHRNFPRSAPQESGMPSDYAMSTFGESLFADFLQIDEVDAFPSLPDMIDAGGGSTLQQDALDEFTRALLYAHDPLAPRHDMPTTPHASSSGTTAWSKQEVLHSLQEGSWSLAYKAIKKRTGNMGI